MRNLIKDQKGSVLVMTAVIMVVILGFAALAIDGGYMYYQKSHLQSAADAAALAGAKVFPSGSSTINSEVTKYTNENLHGEKGVKTPAVTIDNSKKTVLVTIEQDTPKFFAGILTSDNYSVAASARAKYIGSGWAGEALPFLNMESNFSLNSEVLVWKNIAPGDKGTISDFYTKKNPQTYFVIDYIDGVTLEEGFSNGLKGLDNSKLKDGLDEILIEENIGTKYYVLSLKADIIQTLLNGGTFKVTDKKGNKINRKLKDIKQGDVVDPSQLILIECELMSFNLSNNHYIKLEYSNKTYDLGNNDPNNPLPDFPTDYIGPGGSSGSSKLILIED